MYCSVCGNVVNETDTFCPNCGSKLLPNSNEIIQTASAQQIEEGNKNEQKNFGLYLLIGSLGLQVVSVVLGLINPRTGFILFMFSLFLTVVCGIICAVKSKRVIKRKGRKLGIVFSVLAGLSFLILVLAWSGVGANKVSKSVDLVAEKAVGTLYSSLKDPSSLQINAIRGEVISVEKEQPYSDTSLVVRYIIYIDYSAKNGFGGMVRDCYRFVYNNNYELEKCNEIDSIPSSATYDLNEKSYNSLDYSDYVN